MDKINIGFIGGCINRQNGINRSDLYYSVLSEKLSAEKIEHRISLGNYISFDELPSQVKKFINEKQPDLIYVFIRPFPLMPLLKPLVKYDQPDKKIAYALHPALFSRSLSWEEKFSKYQTSGGFEFVQKSVFGFRDLNLLAGRMLGLQSWALNYVMQQLNLVKQHCSQQKIKFRIISPPKNPGSLLANLACKQATSSLAQYGATTQIDLININSFLLADFEKDNIHFNIQGHKKLGRLIYENIISDLKGVRINNEINLYDHGKETRSEKFY